MTDMSVATMCEDLEDLIGVFDAERASEDADVLNSLEFSLQKAVSHLPSEQMGVFLCRAYFASARARKLEDVTNKLKALVGKYS